VGGIIWHGAGCMWVHLVHGSYGTGIHGKDGVLQITKLHQAAFMFDNLAFSFVDMSVQFHHNQNYVLMVISQHQYAMGSNIYPTVPLS